MSNLREAVIKLADENPELRKHLVPILQKTAEYEGLLDEEDGRQQREYQNEQWLRKIRKIDPDVEEYEGYSGRGMYGEESDLAFTSRFGPREPEGKKFQNLGFTVDNMGRNWIYYFK